MPSIPPSAITTEIRGLPLWALTLCVLLTSGGWLGWSAYDDYRNNIEQEYQLLELLAKHREARVTSALSSLNLLLTNIIDDLGTKPGISTAESNAMLAYNLKQLPDIRNLLITDAEGRITSSNNTQIIGFNAVEREYFTAHKNNPASNQIHITRPFVTLTGVTAITASRRLSDHTGHFKGIVVATFDPKLFDSILQFLVPTPDGISFLLNTQGDILYGIPNPAQWQGKNLVGGIAFTEHTASRQATTRHFNRTKLTGQMSMSVFHRIPGTPLITIVSRNYDVLTSNWRNAMLLHLLGFLIIAITTVFLSWLAARRQKSLAQAQAFSARLIDTANVLVVGLDGHGRVVIFNDTAEQVTGYARDEIIGKSWFETVAPQARYPEAWEELQRLQTGSETSTTFDSPLLTKTGQERYVSWRSSRLDIAEENVATVSFGLDITERKTAEVRLAEALQLNHSIVTESPVGIMLYRADGPCIMANAAFAELVGGTLAQLTALNFRHLESWRVTGLLDAALDALEQGREMRREVHTTSIFGKEVWLECRLTPLSLNGVKHLLLLAIDVAGYQAAEDALRDASQLAERSNRAKSEFLANMSHEIRTPMNAVIGLSQLALDEDASPRLRDFLQKILSSSKNLLGIINDILDYSKIESGRIEIEQVPFDLDEVLDNQRNLLATSAAGKGIGFFIDVATNVPHRLHGDPMRLSQVLTNLAGNAIKFTERGEVRITVSCSERSATLVQLAFVISDTGIGMQPEQVANLFQPFVQADGSITRRFGGSGLGLVISRRLLQLMDSEIELDSNPGIGSTFHFVLKLPCSSETLAATAPSAAVVALPAPLVGARILLAEDNPTNRLVAGEFLRRAGCIVVEAENGELALQHALQEHFDAVLMDIHMPVMDGLEATRRIRAQERLRELPIIAVTASVLIEDRDQCLAAGMNAHLGKPLDAALLYRTLTQLMSARAAVSRPADSRQPSASGINAELADMLAASLDKLGALIAASEFIPPEQLDFLREKLAATSAIAALNDLERALLRYDYRQATQALDALRIRLGLPSSGQT